MTATIWTNATYLSRLESSVFSFFIPGQSSIKFMHHIPSLCSMSLNCNVNIAFLRDPVKSAIIQPQNISGYLRKNRLFGLNMRFNCESEYGVCGRLALFGVRFITGNPISTSVLYISGYAKTANFTNSVIQRTCRTFWSPFISGRSFRVILTRYFESTHTIFP